MWGKAFMAQDIEEVLLSEEQITDFASVLAFCFMIFIVNGNERS